MKEIKKYNTVITFGTFDLLHLGHVKILERAKALSYKLIVGVSSDELNFHKKNKYPIYSECDRMEIVSSIKYVEDVFLEERLSLKKDYIIKYRANALVMGDDWNGKFDWCKDVCDVIYLPRTKNVSTTSVIGRIEKNIVL